MPRQTRASGGSQRELFGLEPALKTKVISRRQDFEALFEGFEAMSAISYVVSPDLLLDFLDRRNYSRIEIVVGGEENLAQTYRDVLRKKGVEIVQRLAQELDKERLRVLIPPQVIHSKFYILRKQGLVRVIQGSPNLTRTAQEASRQRNYVWYYDLVQSDPRLKQFEEDYQAHRSGCVLFLGDLQEKLRKEPLEDQPEIIEAWLTGSPIDGQEREMARVWATLAEKATDPSMGPTEIVTIQPGSSVKRAIEKSLQPLTPIVGDGRYDVLLTNFIQYVNRTYNLPIMRVDIGQRKVHMRLGEALLSYGEPIPEPSVLNAALAHIEAYVRAFERGHTSEPKVISETYVYEALLHVLASPFAYLHMSARQRAFRLLTGLRGPRLLYIYGGTRTGKSSFLQFALKTLTNKNIDPIKDEKFFVPNTVRQMANLGTAFPLVFDDIPRFYQNVVKSYWENWWQEGVVWPQVILTSNRGTLPEAAKSRVMRVLFDVYFPPNNADLRYLNDLLARDNPIFTWFVPGYIERLGTEDMTSEDELAVARSVMAELYQFAGRPFPAFFPRRPAEELYPPGARNWRNILYRDKKADMRTERSRVRVDFEPDMEISEVKGFVADLPPAVRCEQHGKTLLIEPPDQFKSWLARGGSARSLVQRLLRR